MGTLPQFVTDTVAGTHQFSIRLVLQFERIERGFAFVSVGGTGDGGSQGIGQVGLVGEVRSLNAG